MLEYQAPVTLHEILKLLNSSTLVNSKRRLLMFTINVAEESGLKYFLHTFRTALTVGSSLNVLLLVILRLLKKYPGWRRIEAAYTAVSSVSL